MIVKLREFIRNIALKIVHKYYIILGVDLKESTIISVHARIDKTYPKGIHIGAYSYIASSALILSHDYVKKKHLNTYIGSNCFIGSGAIVLPGIKVGDNVIIGAGAVVTKDVPSNCIVAGNPAKVIRVGVQTSAYGQLIS